MARALVPGEKPLDWVGSSKRDFLAFPNPVKDEMGNVLGLAQFGGRHPSTKVWKGEGRHNGTMRSTMENRRDDSPEITRGSGNVFADLGYCDAEERQTKLRLAHAINRMVGRLDLTQAQSAVLLGINQPKISALARYRLEGFSVERLMNFLTALDCDVDIVIREKTVGGKPGGRISVIAT